MTKATRTLADELRTPDRVRARVVGLILTQGLAVVDDLHHQGKPSEILEDLLLDLYASSREHRSFESWCHEDLPLALDAIRSVLKPTLWTWRQLVGSVRGDV
ncbi:MAG TPA: hypothetical protein ENK57_02930 [Polyangiaceae bacterium]|nr:hypothetical protein [Polyangiaceae bacterium]